MPLRPSCYAECMKVVVFGASGKVGRLVVAELLKRGHSVVAVTHMSNLPEQPGVTVVKANVYDRTSIENAVAGCDAVISVLGSWGTPQKNVLSTAMQVIIPAMKSNTIKRIVSLTGNGAGLAGANSGLTERLNRLGMLIAAPKVLRDGEDHIQLLADSGLDWTVLRSPPMLANGSAAYKLASRFAGTTIPRQAVATAIVDLIETNDWQGRAPFINRG